MCGDIEDGEPTSPAARTCWLPRKFCVQKETHSTLAHNIQVPIVHVSLLLELSGLQRKKQAHPCVRNAPFPSAGSRTRRGGVCSERGIPLPNWQRLKTSVALQNALYISYGSFINNSCWISRFCRAPAFFLSLACFSGKPAHEDV